MSKINKKNILKKTASRVMPAAMVLGTVFGGSVTSAHSPNHSSNTLYNGGTPQPTPVINIYASGQNNDTHSFELSANEQTLIDDISDEIDDILRNAVKKNHYKSDNMALEVQINNKKELLSLSGYGADPVSTLQNIYLNLFFRIMEHRYLELKTLSSLKRSEQRILSILEKWMNYDHANDLWIYIDKHNPLINNMGSFPWVQELFVVRKKGDNSWIKPAKGWLGGHMPGEYNKEIKNILNFEQIVKLTQKGNSSEKLEI